MLAVVNIWADILATLFVLIAVFFFAFQVLGNIFTGRLMFKFKEGNWPHHDAVVPPLPKIMHGVHVFSMIVLWITGFYIRFGQFMPVNGARDFMKYAHFVCMYAVCIIFVMRVWYAITRDGKEFTETWQDVKNFPRVLMYYLFIAKKYPHRMKYNPLQKMTYGYLFPVSLIIMAVTGFGLMWPKIVYGWAAGFTGGAANAAAWGRVVHFLFAAILLMFTMIHITLSFLEDYPALLIFFGLAKHAEHEEEHDAPKPKSKSLPKTKPVPANAE
jgi:thiosulfate reductase cytochrome b subunit